MQSLVAHPGLAPSREVIDVLGRAAVFSALSGRGLQAAALHAEIRLHRRHDELWREGDPAQDVIVVLAGRIQCSVHGRGGRGWVRDVLRPGGVCGLVALVDGGAHTCATEALETSRVLHVAVAPLRNLLESESGFAFQVARNIARDLRHAIESCSRLALLSPLERLAEYLIENADGGGTVRLRETQGQLAAQLGTVREVVGRAFRRLEVDGLVTRRGRTVRIADRDALERLAR